MNLSPSFILFCLFLSQLEEHAAKAHDVLALKCRGIHTVLNYEGRMYEPLHNIIPLISTVGGDIGRTGHGALDNKKPGIMLLL